MYSERRRKLAEKVKGPVLVASGSLVGRNYPHNYYPFRAASHFLYLAGLAEPDAFALIEEGECTLYYNFPGPEDAVWHGPGPDRAETLARFELKEILAVESLPGHLRAQTTYLGCPEAATQKRLEELTGRPFEPDGRDRQLVDAIIDLRLRHDAEAQAGLREACAVTAQAHKTAMQSTKPGLFEYQVLAELQRVAIGAGMGTSYGPIVSRAGEVLHNPHSNQRLEDGDLLLVDFGTETAGGWAGDVTRTWPVSGKFRPLQKEIYQAVLEAQLAALARCRKGVSYRDVHLEAARVLARGLVSIGLLKGDADGLVERGTIALFFPHGVGHLLGLDVHDMEDLGDRAGYAPGRTRSEQFGLCYLRLDRDLAPGMAVTIEPGFYWNPAILGDPVRMEPHHDAIDFDRLEQAREVRGIRIEDNLIITEGEPEILTSGAPKSVADLEALVGH